ncbi:GumC family protein [Granulicella arctica]|uniref:GumC family protein n=1 Tax=Granulicella arctica TaxID=940613 RepID=UPI0021E0471D|nr:lipopolysaccharide biosynthesis protein [Granulicella arctica]
MDHRQASDNPPGLSLGQHMATIKDAGAMLILASSVMAFIGTVGVSLVPNVYRATTTILVDPQKIPERYVSSTVTSDPNGRMNTLSQQVLSTSRLQEIVDKDNLYPQWRATHSREEVLDYMREHTKIELKQSPEPEQGLSSFSIAYEDKDRALVAKIANDLASSFIDWNLKARQQQALGTTQFLSSELEQAKESLEKQEAQLEQFRRGHAGATPDQLGGNIQALSRLQTEEQANLDAISRLDQERIMLTQAKPPEQRDPAALTERGRLMVERRRLETERWNLKRQFTDTYPDVIAVNAQLKALDVRLAGMPEDPVGTASALDPNAELRLSLIDKEMQRRREMEASMSSQGNSYQAKVDSVPVLETQLAELTRNYEASRQNYQSLLDKTFSAGMSEQLERKQQAERFTVLDFAKAPEKPIRPKRLPLFAIVLLAALIIPAGITVGLQILNGTVKSEVELKTMLPFKIPVLGSIPPIDSHFDIRHRRLRSIQLLTVSALTCGLLVIFLLKTRPIL